MLRAKGLRCTRCGADYPIGHFAEDCPACRPVARANLTAIYDRLPNERPKPAAGPQTLWRYAGQLPLDAADAVSMGEGGTPLIPAPKLADELQLGELLLKDESRNPTWSFKDRLASVAVSAGRKLGAKLIATSSSGNAGAAAAAYAARAGLPCIVFTFTGAAGPMVSQMRAYGAAVAAVTNKADRWRLLDAGVRERGWFPTSPFFGPVVGSNPLGVEGYKTIAYEIAEQLGWQSPDWCVLPVCYGDALYGMWKGFGEMIELGWVDRMPRFVAAEIYGSLAKAMADGGDAMPDMPKTHDTIALSIGATQSTFQAASVLRSSKGVAITVGNEQMREWQGRLARREGLYAEAASVAPLAAVQALRAQGTIARGARVVTLLTASGLKDQDVTARDLPPIPIVPSDLDRALEVINGAYGLRIN